jgi:D-serine deaminase-like pyridoxal phosphate-dependent protein
MKLDTVPTPALIVDLDAFEQNLVAMQKAVNAAGKTLRPHAKAHKRIAIAAKQRDLGAVGVCAATVAELEAFAHAGFPVLLTSPVADSAKVARIAAAPGEVAIVVDHPAQVALLTASGGLFTVLVDLDIGDHRTGVPCDERAIQLARAVDAAANLKFAGLQAYSVSGSHTAGHIERSAHARAALAQAIEVQRDLLRQGLDARRLTGGSTGTWDIDLAIPELTELQAGSYPLMDLAYQKIGCVPFAPAMYVIATVISASHPQRITVDAGYKSFSTDRPFGPEPADVSGVRWQWAGDEHGFLLLDQPSRDFHIGDRIAFVPPHCDPTANLHRYMYAFRGDEVEEVWERC